MQTSFIICFENGNPREPTGTQKAFGAIYVYCMGNRFAQQLRCSHRAFRDWFKAKLFTPTPITDRLKLGVLKSGYLLF